MNQASYIYAGNTENFETLVLENSTKGPVLVYYWADWAGPCRRFFPVLSKVIQDLGGRVLMVSIDTVAQQGLALRQGVNSVPLLKVFHHRREVEQVKGYIPEPELRRMLAQHLPQATDPRITRALRLYQSGEVEAGLTLLAQAALDNPDNPQLPLTLAKLLMAQQRFEEARNILRGLPEAMRDQPGISQLLACTIAEIPLMKSMRWNLVFLAAFILLMLAVVFWPPVSLVLPRMLVPELVGT